MNEQPFTEPSVAADAGEPPPSFSVAFGPARLHFPLGQSTSAVKLNVLFLTCLATIAVCCGCQHRLSGVIGRVRGIDGLTEQQLIAKMGEPLRRDEFLASAAAGEFRTGLERIAARLQKEDVRIHELTWDRANSLVTAWLYETNGTWIAFDNLKYGKNVRF